MTPRALSPDMEREAAEWYEDFLRVGTFSGKARALGVSRSALRDAIRRYRGEITTPIRRKLSQHEIDALAEELVASSTGNTSKLDDNG